MTQTAPAADDPARPTDYVITAADECLTEAIAAQVAECGRAATAELLRSLANGLEQANG